METCVYCSVVAAARARAAAGCSAGPRRCRADASRSCAEGRAATRGGPSLASPGRVRADDARSAPEPRAASVQNKAGSKEPFSSRRVDRPPGRARRRTAWRPTGRSRSRCPLPRTRSQPRSRSTRSRSSDTNSPTRRPQLARELTSQRLAAPAAGPRSGHHRGGETPHPRSGDWRARAPLGARTSTPTFRSQRPSLAHHRKKERSRQPPREGARARSSMWSAR